MASYARISYCYEVHGRCLPTADTRRTSISLRVELYLVPVRFHVYDAYSDLLALGAAPNISQSSSFASASALRGMSCGVSRCSNAG
jgi:hypothetical protein